ncbi:diguanylate cyclase domain-containing protein [Thiomicrorhabdus sp. Kp2]|uniref:diguanylate cyclase domain-containing protein n=1 Tax=Thiomicrorhabdus sp. Kp2 TaxID=1123518 RepID=UPI0009DBBADC|nr:diguanylate cyclase [Thiomicrorhabdus sp. Kp2]
MKILGSVTARMIKRISGLISLLFVCALQAEDSTLKPITLQLKWHHQFQFAGYYAAIEKGFYKEVGLEVSLLEAKPGIDPISVVLNKQADFGVGTSDLVLAFHKGDPITILGVIMQHSPLNLMTLSESNINHVHKFIGKRLMIEPNSAELFAYMQSEGIHQSALTLETHSHNVNDLINSKADVMSVYSTDEPYILAEQGIRFQLFSPRMSGIDFYGDNFFTLQSLVEKDPQLVRNFYQATIKGWKYAMSHQEEIVQLIYQKYSQQKSLEHLRFEAKSMDELMMPKLIEPGYMTEGRWRHIADTYHSLGILPEKINLQGLLYQPNYDFEYAQLQEQLKYIALVFIVLLVLIIGLTRLYRTTHARKEQLDTIFMESPLSLIVMDKAGNVQKWNRQAEKTFLWKEKDVIGKSLVELLVPEKDQTKVAEVLANTKESRASVVSENRNVRKDGSEIMCEWVNAPYQNALSNETDIICMARDITKRKALEAKLYEAAQFDWLTGIANSNMLSQLMKQQLVESKRDKSHFALLFIDIDDYKQVNDLYGHLVGDEVLKVVAQRLRNSIRESDIVGRYAGDEFVILLRGIETDIEVDALVKKIMNEFIPLIHLNEVSLQVRISIGSSIYPQDSDDIEGLIQYADKEMYHAKTINKAKHKAKENR